MKVNQQKLIELSFPQTGIDDEGQEPYTVRLDSRFDSGNIGSASFDLADPRKVTCFQRDRRIRGAGHQPQGKADPLLKLVLLQSDGPPPRRHLQVLDSENTDTVDAGSEEMARVPPRHSSWKAGLAKAFGARVSFSRLP